MSHQHKHNVKNTDSFGDSIENLQMDENPPNHDELEVMDTLFKKEVGVFEKIMNSAKDSLLVGILFVIFSLPYFDQLVLKFIPSLGNSAYMMMGFKVLVLMIVHYLIKNLYLVKKK